MAIYHLSVSTRARGFGASHASYIERSGKYAGKDDLEASASGNMRSWLSSRVAYSSIDLDAILEKWRSCDPGRQGGGRKSKRCR